MSRPDPDDEKQDPVSRGATEMDPQERQFWDLDDDEDLHEDPDDDQAGPKTPAPAEAESPGDEEGPSEPETPAEEDSDADDGKEGSEGADEDADGPVSLSSGTQIEKISLIAFGVLLVGLGVWITTAFLSDLPTEDPNAPADMPVKGAKVTIRDIETYWRDPDPENDRGVRAGVTIIPSTEIVLKKRDGKGALRIFFEDADGGLTGDPVTLSFSNGTFSSNGKDRIEAYCTEGFTDQGDFPAYVTGQTDSWFLIVKEGPGAQARGSEFKEIVRTPILPEKR